jgi:hypothetical protein
MLAEEAGYRSACTVEICISKPSDDPLALPRVPITGYDTLLDFIWRLSTALSVGEWLRRQRQRVTRRVAAAQRV